MKKNRRWKENGSKRKQKETCRLKRCLSCHRNKYLLKSKKVSGALREYAVRVNGMKKKHKY